MKDPITIQFILHRPDDSGLLLFARRLQKNEPLPQKNWKISLPQLNPKIIEKVGTNEFIVHKHPIFEYNYESQILSEITIVVRIKGQK